MPKENIKNAIQDTELKYIKDDITQLKESYKTLNDHSTQMTNDISKIKADMEWLTWAMRGVIFAILVSITITIFSVILK